MRKLLTGLFGFAGVMHFATPKVFDDLVPTQLPGTQRAWTLGSGALELISAALLAYRPTRKIGGLVSAILLVGVWPGNFQMAWDYRKKCWWKKLIAFARLPLQIPMIRGAWRIYRNPDEN